MIFNKFFIESSPYLFAKFSEIVHTLIKKEDNNSFFEYLSYAKRQKSCISSLKLYDI